MKPRCAAGRGPLPLPPRLAALLAAAVALLALAAGPARSGGPRYPLDLALDPEGRSLFTANEESGSVSAIDLASGAVTDELPIDPRGRPHAIAVAERADGSFLLAVSERFTHRLAIIAAAPRPRAPPGEAPPASLRLRLLGEVPCGRLPAGIAFAPAESAGAGGAPAGGGPAPRILAACEGEGEVWEIDADALRAVRRIPAVEGARRLAVMSAAGETPARLAVAGRTEVALLDLATGRMLARRSLAGGTARNLEGLAAHGESLLVAHQVQPTESPIDPQMLNWGLILANRVTVLAPEDGALGERVIALDLRSRAAGDPGRLAFIAGKGLILVPSAGTGRLLFAELSAAPSHAVQPLSTDARPPELRLGSRPTSVRASPAGDKAYVALYLEDAIAEVDITARRVLRTFRLGAAPEETPAHLGARIFYDADRSLDGWYSCHSCHPSGGTAGHGFNTSADGRGLAKRTPSLHGTAATGPWSWLGRFPALEDQVAASLETTMAAREAAPREDVERVAAFVRSLPRPDPVRPGEDLGGDPGRGALVFERAACARCHEPPAYTSGGAHDLGLQERLDDGARYNPPALAGVRDRFRFLHDGRAASLEAVFREHDPLGLHGQAKELADGDLRDLIAFLKTL